MKSRILLGAALAAGALSCGGFSVPDSGWVPANPVWETNVKGEPDVKTILADHCNNCHGADPGRGAGSGGASLFRTDTYKNVDGRIGARDGAIRFAETVKSGRMPPGAGSDFGTHNTAILQKWADALSPETH